jgi:hypothetical protein
MIIGLISFLGLIIGYIIAHNTKEELNLGKKYFELFAGLILLSLIFLLIKFDLYFLIGIILGIMINYFIKKIYLFLGISFLLNNLLLSFLIFIFGLFYGTLDYIKFKKINYNDILINFILFIFPLILIKLNINLLKGVLVGGILIELSRINSGFKK